MAYHPTTTVCHSKTMYMLWIWLALVVATAIVEFTTVQMVSIWFTAGGIFALIAYASGAPYWAQIIVFGVTSIVCLFAFRKIAVNWLKKHLKENTNVDSLIGRNVVVVDDINADDAGSVKINDVVWTALSKDGFCAQSGSRVKIVAIEGNKLIVAPSDATNNKGEQL